MKFLSAATCLCIALVGQIQGGSLRGLPVPLPHQTYGVPVNSDIQSEGIKHPSLPIKNDSETNEDPRPSGAFIDNLPLVDSVGNVGKPADNYGPPTEKNEVPHPSDASIGNLPLDNSVVNFDKSPDSYGLPTLAYGSDIQKHEDPSDFLPNVDKLPLVDSTVNFGNPAEIYGPPTEPTTIDIRKHQDPSVFHSHVDILPLVDSAVDFGKSPEAFVSSTTAKPELPYLPPGLPALPKLPFRPIVVEELDHVDHEPNSGVPSAGKVENQTTHGDIHEPPGTPEVSEDSEPKIPETSVTGKPSPVYGPPSTSEALNDIEQQFPTLSGAPVTAHPTTPRGSEVLIDQDNGFKNPGEPSGIPPAPEISNNTEQETGELPEGPSPTTPNVSEVPVEPNNDIPKPNETYGPPTTPPATNFDEHITINKIPELPEAPAAGNPSVEQDNAYSRPNEVNAPTTAQMVVLPEGVPADHPTTPMISEVSVEKNDGLHKPIEHYGPSPTTKPINANEKIVLPTIDKIPALPEYPIIPHTTSAEVSEVPEKQNYGYNYEIPEIGFTTPTNQDAKIPFNPAKPLDKPASYPPAEEIENSKPSTGYRPPTWLDGLETSAALPANDYVKPNVVNRPPAGTESLEVPTIPSTQQKVKPNEVYGPPAGSEPLQPSTTAIDKRKPNEPYGTPQIPDASSDTGKFSFPIITQIPALPNAPTTAHPMSSESTKGPPKQTIGYNYEATAVGFPIPVIHPTIGIPTIPIISEISALPNAPTTAHPMSSESTKGPPKQTIGNNYEPSADSLPIPVIQPTIGIPTFPVISEIPALPNAPKIEYPTVPEGPPKQTIGYNYDTPAVSFPTPINHATEVPIVSISPSIVIPTKVHEPSMTAQHGNQPLTGENTQDQKPSELYGSPAGSKPNPETSSATSGIDKVNPNEVYPRPQKVDTSTSPKQPQHPIISKIRALAEIPHLFKKAFVESLGITVPEFPVSTTKSAPRSVFKPSFLTATSYGSQLPVQPLILEEFVPIYEPTTAVNDRHKPRNVYGPHVGSPTHFGYPMRMHAIPKLFDRVQLSPISGNRGPQHIPLLVEEFQTVPSSLGSGTTGTFSNLVGAASPNIYQAYPALVYDPNAFISQKGHHRETVSASVSTSSHQVNHYTAPNKGQTYPDSIVVEEPKKGRFTIHSITGQTENSSVKSFSHVSIVPHSSSIGTTAGHHQ